MKNLFKYCILFFSIYVSSLFSITPTHHIESLGTVELGEIHPYDAYRLNDKDQIIGTHCVKTNSTQLFIWDKKKGFDLLQLAGLRYSRIEKSFSTFNNKGQLLIPDRDPYPGIWSESKGFQQIQPEECKELTGFSDINNFGDVVGSYIDKQDQLKLFLWVDSRLVDLPLKKEIEEEIESLGFCFFDAFPLCINDNGEISGVIRYSKYDKYQDRYLIAGCKYFFWDTERVELLPIETREHPHYPDRMDMNNNGDIMIVDSSHCTYLWHRISSWINTLDNFRGIRINDQRGVIGYKDFSKPPKGDDYQLWSNGKFKKIHELFGMIPQPGEFADDYSFEEIVSISDMNNNGTILGIGKIWGRNHPFLIRPNNLQKTGLN